MVLAGFVSAISVGMLLCIDSLKSQQSDNLMFLCSVCMLLISLARPGPGLQKVFYVFYVFCFFMFFCFMFFFVFMFFCFYVFLCSVLCFMCCVQCSCC